jgi:hypothetical protein
LTSRTLDDSRKVFEAAERDAVLFEALRKRDVRLSFPATGTVGRVGVVDLIIRSEGSPTTGPMSGS